MTSRTLKIDEGYVQYVHYRLDYATNKWIEAEDRIAAYRAEGQWLRALLCRVKQVLYGNQCNDLCDQLDRLDVPYSR